MAICLMAVMAVASCQCFSPGWGQPDPTIGVHNHRQESIEFFKIFPDNHLINNPYKILIAEGDYTCSVADFTGTFKCEMKGLDGKMIQPTNKKFHIEFCIVAHWKDGKILEEGLFYDQMGMLKAPYSNDP